MGSFLRDIADGFASGTALGASTSFFDLTAILFFFSTVGYIVYLAWRKRGVWLGAYAVAIVGAVALTAALALRWIAAGWDHPPFTNLYESLVFFGWGIVVFYVVIEAVYKVRVAGALVIPIAFLALGMAALSPNKGLAPLMPALQDVWLHLHVFSASIGYAAFLVAFGFSVLFLIKEGVPIRYFGIASSLFTLFAAATVTKGQVLFLQYTLTKVARAADGGVHAIVMPGTDVKALVIVPQGGLILACACLLLIVATILLGSATDPVRRVLTRWGFNAFLAGTFLFTLFLVHVFTFAGSNAAVSMREDVYGIAFFVCAWLLAVLTVIVYLKRESLAESLPTTRSLDTLAYKSVIVAFPIMTFVIVSGAVWANKAWGRYWGWDPKETASLITWVIYLLYLHARFTRGWTGRRAALISIIGFVSVVFTYLGVNLVLSGLHSYATG